MLVATHRIKSLFTFTIKDLFISEPTPDGPQPFYCGIELPMGVLYRQDQKDILKNQITGLHYSSHT